MFGSLILTHVHRIVTQVVVMNTQIHPKFVEDMFSNVLLSVFHSHGINVHGFYGVDLKKKHIFMISANRCRLHFQCFICIFFLFIFFYSAPQNVASTFRKILSFYSLSLYNTGYSVAAFSRNIYIVSIFFFSCQTEMQSTVMYNSDDNQE